ncbi:MAG: hypothetical protein GWN85_24580 [Gemmatimonadetes bacterium]|nr:hypothetical protein [Gemmatimonadota bacterium]NIR36046.1 hypothetical protein [Actinomycetota bacterium]NIS30305.1 hypothetical protein [Actinomycetota bacterium]NIU65532.1 hypothetical protein [Actinomycetota bacterium]NIW27349.1 hypothetical protein [Actinomycetota bacterium]
MIYYPRLQGAGLGLDEPSGGPVFLFGDGAATSSLVIIVPDFVDPEIPVGR